MVFLCISHGILDLESPQRLLNEWKDWFITFHLIFVWHINDRLVNMVPVSFLEIHLLPIRVHPKIYVWALVSVSILTTYFSFCPIQCYFSWVISRYKFGYFVHHSPPNTQWWLYFVPPNTFCSVYLTNSEHFDNGCGVSLPVSLCVFKVASSWLSDTHYIWVCIHTYIQRNTHTCMHILLYHLNVSSLNICQIYP